MTRTLHFQSDRDFSDDAELRDLGDYLDGSMTAVRRQGFRQRLADDPALFRRVGPIMSVWYRPTPLPAEQEVLDEIQATLAAHRAGATGGRMATATMRTTPARPLVMLLAAAAALVYFVVPGERAAPVAPQLAVAPTVNQGESLIPLPTGRLAAVVEQTKPARVARPTSVAPVYTVPSLDSATERLVAGMTAQPMAPVYTVAVVAIPQQNEEPSATLAYIDSAKGSVMKTIVQEMTQGPVGRVGAKTGVTAKGPWWKEIIPWFARRGRSLLRPPVWR